LDEQTQPCDGTPEATGDLLVFEQEIRDKGGAGENPWVDPERRAISDSFSTFLTSQMSQISSLLQIPDFTQPYEIVRQTSQAIGSETQASSTGPARWMAAK